MGIFHDTGIHCPAQTNTHTHTEKDPNEDPNELVATESGLNEQNRLEII